jgi:hypothetical protein
VVPAGSSAHGFSCSRRLSPLSGRNSTYRLVQISGTGSTLGAVAKDAHRRTAAMIDECALRAFGPHFIRVDNVVLDAQPLVQFRPPLDGLERRKRRSTAYRITLRPTFIQLPFRVWKVVLMIEAFITRRFYRGRLFMESPGHNFCRAR